jgi:hypothetical protein
MFVMLPAATLAGRSACPDTAADSRGSIPISAAGAVTPDAGRVGAVAPVATSPATAYLTPACFVNPTLRALVYAVFAPARRVVSFGVLAMRVSAPSAATVYTPNRTSVGVAPAAVPDVLTRT